MNRSCVPTEQRHEGGVGSSCAGAVPGILFFDVHHCMKLGDSQSSRHRRQSNMKGRRRSNRKARVPSRKRPYGPASAGDGRSVLAARPAPCAHLVQRYLSVLVGIVVAGVETAR